MLRSADSNSAALREPDRRTRSMVIAVACLGALPVIALATWAASESDLLLGVAAVAVAACELVGIRALVRRLVRRDPGSPTHDDDT
jgi:hypothetical protein